ncbi:hypothetical protein KEM52_001163 [Ascosphaera acerosa]|nr:hypothetical protein KEM52_001163 [Ascosphaera acerosa]
MTPHVDGKKALEAKDFPRAVVHFTRALSQDPFKTDSLNGRSDAWNRLQIPGAAPASTTPGPTQTSDENHLQRQAYLRSLADAERALALASVGSSNARIAEAQYRRGLALYKLQRWADARVCLRAAARRVEQSQSFAGSCKLLERQVSLLVERHEKEAADADGRSGGDGDSGARLAVTVLETPAQPAEQKQATLDALKKCYQAELEAMEAALENGDISALLAADHVASVTPPAVSSDGDSARADAATAQTPTAVLQTPRQDIRHEWYQTNDDLVLTFYAKGYTAKDVHVDFQPSSLTSLTSTLQFHLQLQADEGESYTFKVNPLLHPVDCSASSYKAMSKKVEVRLRKQTPGVKWSALEGSKSGAVPDSALPPPAPATATTPTVAAPRPDPLAPSQQQPSVPPQSAGPVYPTSSRKGAKDWDKLAAELSKKAKQEKKGKTSVAGTEAASTTAAAAAADKDETGGTADDDDGDDDSDYGGDPVDRFFKKLYANADPDTRRAMMKSYIESEGTALSTNWAEVGKKKVEPHKE